MATTAKGTPYVVSSDLVSGYPATSLSLANQIDDKLKFNAVTYNAQTGTTYTFVLADATLGKIVTASNASSSTYTVPPQSSVTWLTGHVLTVVNLGAGVVTFAGGSGVTVTNTAATLAQYQSATIIRTGSDAWTVVPFSGGGSRATVTSTTGSPTVTTVNGKTNYAYTGAGSITFATSGYVRALVCGAGGGGGGSNSSVTSSGAGGGGGGQVNDNNIYVVAGFAYAVGVGSGGSGSTGINNGASGGSSFFGPILGVGGGGGGHADNGSGTSNTGGTTGGNGGAGGSTGGVGGNASNGSGGAQSSGNGGVGGNGLVSDITGSSVSYAYGGGGGAGSTAGKTGGTSASGGNGGDVSANGTTATQKGGGGGGAGHKASGTGGSGAAGYVVIQVG